MTKFKVLVVFGTRPEAIKMAPIIKQLENHDFIECIVCVTAQHREMLDQVLNVFKINPRYDLNIMKKKQTLVDITSNALIKLDKVIKEVSPDLVLVHGDTTTTLCGSLAAYYNKVKLGHVEAGLRTYNKYSPFPEELNRKLTSSLADIHFAPTEISKENLLRENIKEELIFVTGNTSIDALQTTIIEEYRNNLLDKIGKDRIILLTAHRRENLGENMENIFRAINRILHDFDDTQVIYPIHLNPKIRHIADEVIEKNDKMHIIEPLEVIDFHNFMNKSYLILTDSGGIQEEAPYLGKPVLVIRNTTERPEGIIAGTLKMAGTEENSVYDLVCQLLENKDLYNSMSKASNPYGDGNASKYIVDAIEKMFILK